MAYLTKKLTKKRVRDLSENDSNSDYDSDSSSMGCWVDKCSNLEQSPQESIKYLLTPVWLKLLN